MSKTGGSRTTHSASSLLCEHAEHDSQATRKDEWIRPFFKQNKGLLILTLILGVFTSIFASALMFTSGYLITRAAEMPGTILMIHLPLLFVRIFGIGKPVLQYLERLTSHDWVLHMTSNLRLKLYTVLEGGAVFSRSKQSTGSILGLLSEDIGHLQNLFLRVVFPTVVAWLLYLIVVIAAGFFSWWFALAMFVLLGICVVLMPLVSVLVNRVKQQQRKHIKHKLYAELTDNVLGVSDWVFSGRNDEYLKHYEATEGALDALDTRMQTYGRLRDLVLRVIFAAIIVVILIWSAGAFGGAPGGASNWIAACILGFFPLIDVFGSVSESATEATEHKESEIRLNELSESSASAGKTGKRDSATHEPAFIKHSQHSQRTQSSPSTQTASTSVSTSVSEPSVLEVQHVYFSYPGSNEPVLKNLDLAIKPGEKVAILGRSGAGKSTLASLLRGDLVPDSGTITLAGIPSSEYGDEIAHHLGMIQQQTYLFNWTLKDNLTMGNADITDAELWDVLDKVGLSPMVHRLPDKLETLVDEGGRRFSGGERHRIALARVLLHQVPLVILDEPMVGLDPLTEHALLLTLLEVLSDKTVIMITHHLAGVSQMDRVLFIDEGKIALDGKPHELEQSNTYYQKLLAFDKGL